MLSSLPGSSGLGDIFEDIFDIVAADLVPNPTRAPIRGVFRSMLVSIPSAPRCSKTSRAISSSRTRRGMTTVLVLPEKGSEPEREAWEVATGDEPHVDFVTDDLVGFLEGLAAN